MVKRSTPDSFQRRQRTAHHGNCQQQVKGHQVTGQGSAEVRRTAPAASKGSTETSRTERLNGKKEPAASTAQRSTGKPESRPAQAQSSNKPDTRKRTANSSTRICRADLHSLRQQREANPEAGTCSEGRASQAVKTLPPVASSQDSAEAAR
ncbi:MAG: hypothetical protein MZV63_32245 [Marinilabiliales bacterium]|nr:hypothetical protein [Marinilabiliales bacterium]